MNKKSLKTERLPNGKLLGEATICDVALAVAIYADAAKSETGQERERLLVEARILQQIMQKVGDNNKVIGECLKAASELDNVKVLAVVQRIARDIAAKPDETVADIIQQAAAAGNQEAMFVALWRAHHAVTT